MRHSTVSLLILYLLLFPVFIFSQFSSPSWVDNACIYEVNIRQFSEDGTFEAFEKELPRLKEMGIDVIWLMPIHPIGELNRKGSMGSYYAVRDYKKVNSEFGDLNSFKSLVQSTHELGLKIIIDWVANHSSPDNIWIEQGKLDWYTLDSLGNIQPTIGTDWWDVADLNYNNQDMRKEMIESMKYWVKECDIDGFRCDVAGWVPIDFWVDARKQIEQIKPIFFLAEAEGNELCQAFDMTYGWEFHHIMNELYQGNKTKLDFYEYFSRTQNSPCPQMHFTSNHDENSWNGTVGERLGESKELFAVMSSVVGGMPLIYNGQETSLNKRLKFFEKDAIDWSKMDLVDFYSQIFELKKSNAALSLINRSQIDFIPIDSSPNLLGFYRKYGNDIIICFFNLGNESGSFTLPEVWEFKGRYKELHTGKGICLKKNKSIEIPAWGYKVYYR